MLPGGHSKANGHVKPVCVQSWWACVKPVLWTDVRVHETGGKLIGVCLCILLLLNVVHLYILNSASDRTHTPGESCGRVGNVVAGGRV